MSATFRPTRRQRMARGLYLGVFGTPASVAAGLVPGLPGWAWVLLILVPPAAGVAGGLVAGRRTGIEVGAAGIRTSSVFEAGEAPWSRVVDLRAERRGSRTVVAVYLDSGASVLLHAPYSGDLFAADPRFELKVFALANMWRSHRFGGLPG
ncbi:MAG TPA: hypothetical protein VN408_10790 [Actinoplanes sp.]|nr:hypothetical protein [Actinoplanes sp.]